MVAIDLVIGTHEGLGFSQSFLESIYPQITPITRIKIAPAEPTIHAENFHALLRKPSKLLDYLNQIQSAIVSDSICANCGILSTIRNFLRHPQTEPPAGGELMNTIKII